MIAQDSLCMDIRSGQSPWNVGGEGNISSPFRGPQTCQVLVVGLGITGALVVDRLSAEGINCIAIDCRAPFQGSTRASTAMLLYELDSSLVELQSQMGEDNARQVYRLCHEAVIAWGEIAKNLDCDVGFEQRTGLYLATSDRAAKRLESECRARNAVGIPVRILTSREISAEYSFSARGALQSSTAAAIDPVRAAYALLARAKKRGARLFSPVSLEGLEPYEGGVRAKVSDGGCVMADKIIIATGYESSRWLPKKVINLQSTYAIATTQLESFQGWNDRCLIWDSHDPYFYLRSTPDNRAVIGGFDSKVPYYWWRDLWIGRNAAKLLKKFHKMFPDIRAEVAYQWTGTFGESEDSLPYIGAHPKIPRVYFVIGVGGNGMVFSLLGSEMSAAWVKGEAIAHAQLFSFERNSHTL